MNLTTIQSKLVAAQNCHPGAVQTLVAEALEEIDKLACGGQCLHQISEPSDLTDAQIDSIAEGVPAPAAAAPQGDLDADLGRTIVQRDMVEDWADGLAGLIGKYFGCDIGEHSSAHCPWQEAKGIIEEAEPYQPAAVAGPALTPVEHQALEALCAVAVAAFRVADDSPFDGGGVVPVEYRDMQALVDAVDKLDRLPNDQPGQAMPPGERARWTLLRMLDTAPALEAPAAPMSTAEACAALAINSALHRIRAGNADAAIEPLEQARAALAQAPAAPKTDEDILSMTDALVMRHISDARDAARLRWLLEDHASPAVRVIRNSLCERLPGMSYSAACADIDAAIAAQQGGAA